MSCMGGILLRRDSCSISLPLTACTSGLFFALTLTFIGKDETLGLGTGGDFTSNETALLFVGVNSGLVRMGGSLSKSCFPVGGL
jgi:hypothetical protein